MPRVPGGLSVGSRKPEYAAGRHNLHSCFQREPTMMLKKLSLAIGLVLAGSTAFAGGTSFEDFTPLVGDTVAGSLPESAPFVLSSPHFSQINIATQIGRASCRERV